MTVGAIQIPVEQALVERRLAVRFPLDQAVRFKAFNRSSVEVGAGRTVNVSSNGILFTTDLRLHRGQRVELALNWPAQLDRRHPLKLVTLGRVVRVAGNSVAITIERYEFRTQGARGLM